MGPGGGRATRSTKQSSTGDTLLPTSERRMRKTTEATTTFVYWCLWILFRVLATALFRVRFLGQERIPKKGGVLIVANHASILDIPLLGCGIRRHISFMGRDNLFPIPILNPLLQRLGWIPIRQNCFDRKGFRRAERLLREGQAVAIFPGRCKNGDRPTWSRQIWVRDTGREDRMPRSTVLTYTARLRHFRQGLAGFLSARSPSCMENRLISRLRSLFIPKRSCTVA